ncbi:sulphydryl oxidase Sox [Aspergillus terreus]|uniref:Sulphydryl oxidase Sox n=1 Tax=Aspergillus terreus TaxID=33178 RepID=A0A5M3ZAK6_ASPTE|nr:hypothetical protein ATETN484_0013010500 [Aspergillus terreus]GFF20339.1 sulphydryl oxidase Sox [Aspergillus terreus]
MAPKSLLYTLFSSLTAALAASVPDTGYDVIVVGGGPAGLSALSGLSRVRRTAVMFDSGEYRNAPTRNMHDVIGNDGTPPAEFRGLAREQISRYDTASIVDKKIVTIAPLTDDNATAYFEATDTDGTVYSARKVVLATGLQDLLPATPGLEEIWGKGAYWCPWCDGYEHRDQPIGIVGSLADAVGSMLEIHTLNTDIVALANGTQTPEVEAQLAADKPDWQAQLAAWNVRIDNRTIESFRRLQDGEEHQDDQGRQFDIFEVRFTDGSTLVRNAFITNFPTAQRSTLPADLGLQMVDGKIDTSSFSGMRTSLPGVFAIGDANSDGSTNVPHAMFSGKRAAVYMHVEMAREESAAAISKRNLPSRRAMEKEAERLMGRDLEALWEQVQGQ